MSKEAICKNCAFWGKGNLIEHESNGKLYKWCGSPQSGQFYNGGIADIEVTREDFGCVCFRLLCKTCGGSGRKECDDCSSTGECSSIGHCFTCPFCDGECTIPCPDCPSKEIVNTTCAECKKVLCSTNKKERLCPNCQTDAAEFVKEVETLKRTDFDNFATLEQIYPIIQKMSDCLDEAVALIEKLQQ